MIAYRDRERVVTTAHVCTVENLQFPDILLVCEKRDPLPEASSISLTESSSSSKANLFRVRKTERQAWTLRVAPTILSL
jgi:hypothetical protein